MTVGNYSTLKKVATTPPARQTCESGGRGYQQYQKIMIQEAQILLLQQLTRYLIKLIFIENEIKKRTLIFNNWH